MVDIDFLTVEYDESEPIAIIEYKYEDAPKKGWNSNYAALFRLSNRASVGFFLVRYSKCPWMFDLYPINGIAKTLSQRQLQMTEEDYVTFLYSIRGRPMPDTIRHIIRSQS